jgi:hypothetical protein
MAAEPGLVIALGSPRKGGAEGEPDDQETLDAIEDATKQYFEAGAKGDYKKAAELQRLIADMQKVGGSPPQKGTG